MDSFLSTFKNEKIERFKDIPNVMTVQSKIWFVHFPEETFLFRVQIFCLMTNISWKDKAFYTILSCHIDYYKFLWNNLIKYVSLNFPTSIFAFIKYLNMKQDNYHFLNTKKTWRSCTKIRSSFAKWTQSHLSCFLKTKIDGRIILPLTQAVCLQSNFKKKNLVVLNISWINCTCTLLRL